MDALTLSLSSVVAALGASGLTAALVAWQRVHREQEILEKGAAQLRQNSPDLAEPSSSPDNWLHAAGYPEDSHFGDGLMAAWGGWLAGRVPTLAELHNLAARRERRRFSARFAGGITGVLVVIGIAGTLSSIHPILSGFNIASTANGVVDASARAGQANKLIQDLGSAFFPSLVALGLTVVVAAVRGMYSQATSNLALKLDRFAVDFLFPTFRVRTFGEELRSVQENLSVLVLNMQARDAKLGELVGELKNLATGLTASTEVMRVSGQGLGEASKSLKADLGKLGSDLGGYLGSNAPIMVGLAHLDKAVRINKSAAEELATASTALARTAQDAAANVAAACQRVQQAAAAVPESIRQGCVAGSQEVVAAAQGAALVITATVQTGNTALHQTIAGASAAMHTGAQQAGEVFIGSCATATQAVLTSIAEQVAPITEVAGRIDVAHDTFQKEVRGSLGGCVAEFTSASRTTLAQLNSNVGAVVTSIHTELGATVSQLTATERAATAAATMARDVLQPATELLNVLTLPKRWWERLTGGKPK